jgi:hypothetical protein
MKKAVIIVLVAFCLSILSSGSANAQCSICTRTAQQLGEKSARGLNAGIIYLAFTPLVLAGFIGYRWWRREKQVTEENVG